MTELEPETPDNETTPDEEIPPSEDREQCPGHETDAGILTHAVYPQDCRADGFDV